MMFDSKINRQALGKIGLFGSPYHGIVTELTEDNRRILELQTPIGQRFRAAPKLIPDEAPRAFAEYPCGTSFIFRDPRAEDVTRSDEELSRDESAGISWLSDVVYSPKYGPLFYEAGKSMASWIWHDKSTHTNWVVTLIGLGISLRKTRLPIVVGSNIRGGSIYTHVDESQLSEDAKNPYNHFRPMAASPDGSRVLFYTTKTWFKLAGFGETGYFISGDNQELYELEIHPGGATAVWQPVELPAWFLEMKNTIKPNEVGVPYYAKMVSATYNNDLSVAIFVNRKTLLAVEEGIGSGTSKTEECLIVNGEIESRQVTTLTVEATHSTFGVVWSERSELPLSILKLNEPDPARSIGVHVELDGIETEFRDTYYEPRDYGWDRRLYGPVITDGSWFNSAGIAYLRVPGCTGRIVSASGVELSPASAGPHPQNPVVNPRSGEFIRNSAAPVFFM